MMPLAEDKHLSGPLITPLSTQAGDVMVLKVVALILKKALW